MDDMWALPVMTERTQIMGLLPGDVWVGGGCHDNAIVCYPAEILDMDTARVWMMAEDGLWPIELSIRIEATVSPAAYVQEWS